MEKEGKQDEKKERSQDALKESSQEVKKPRLKDSEKERILELHAAGMSIQKIADDLGRHRTTIDRFFKEKGLKSMKVSTETENAVTAANTEPDRQMEQTQTALEESAQEVEQSDQTAQETEKPTENEPKQPPKDVEPIQTMPNTVKPVEKANNKPERKSEKKKPEKPVLSARVSEEILKMARAYAVATRTTLEAVMSEAIRAYVSANPLSGKALTVFEFLMEGESEV